MASGLITARAMRVGMVVAFALATLAGAYLTWVAGPAIVVIGLLSIASGVAYTGGAFPLGYHGLGDVFVLAFFGLVAVCGTVFAQTGVVPLEAWFASVPVGLIPPFVTAYLLSKDIPGNRLFRAIIFAPTALSWVVIGMVGRQVFSSQGPISAAS